MDSVVSAPTTTTFGLRRPSAISALPKYDRWLSIFHGPAVKSLPPELRARRGRASVRRRSSPHRDTYLVLHERDAFAFHGPRDHGGRSAFCPVGLFDCREDLAEV